MNDQESTQRTIIARLGPYMFDRREYDPDTDTLRLFWNEAADAVREIDSREGHRLLLDAAGVPVGMVILHYEDSIFETGPIEVSIPLPGTGDASDDPEQTPSYFLWMPAGPATACC